MNILSVEGLSKTWHDKKILNNLTFGISEGEKVALVANNGHGKSTLLKIIFGEEKPDSGIAIIRKGIAVGYLSQDPILRENDSVLNNVFYKDSELLRAIAEYETAVEATSNNANEKSILQLEKATEKMNLLQAWDYENKVKLILTKLKITNFNQAVNTLSGGQKKRVALAGVLISEPNFIILDEPTNHLDLEMIEWLENYLQQKDITLFLVTHDRFFLDRVCDSIIELYRGNVFHYKGNYSYYVQNKIDRQQVELSELEKDKNLYRRELDWVRRMPKARTGKSKSRIDSFENLEQKIKQFQTDAELKITMRMERLGGKILELHKVSKKYDNKILLEDFSYIFKSGEKLGIVGPNGSGKTTLLNMMMQQIEPDTGKIIHGETVNFGYFSQNNPSISEGKKVIDVIRDVAEWIPMANGHKLSASQLLLQFQFTPEMQHNYVSKLSGGERRRLFLVQILMRSPNFLILDEPTNDLDIQTLNILEEFLQQFSGCVIIVSHDRFFMDKVVDHLFVFEGNGKIKDFAGNYSDFREWLDLQEDKKELNASKSNLPTENTKTSQIQKKLTFKEKYELDQLVKEIAELQKEKIEIEAALNENLSDYEKITSLSIKLEEIKNQLDEKEMRWLELDERS